MATQSGGDDKIRDEDSDGLPIRERPDDYSENFRRSINDFADYYVERWIAEVSTTDDDGVNDG